MHDTLSRAAAWLRARWARCAFAAAVAYSAWLLASDPIVLREMALNVVRAGCALVMFEGALRYTTRTIAQGLARATGQAAPRFADLFDTIRADSLALSLFLSSSMLARAVIVWAVWR